MNNNFSKNKNKTNTELKNATTFLTVSTTGCTFAASDIHDENNRVICSLVAQWMQLWHVITNEAIHMSHVWCATDILSLLNGAMHKSFISYVISITIL